MSEDERLAYIRQVVDSAPSLSAEDATRLRALIPLGARRTAEASPRRATPPRSRAA